MNTMQIVEPSQGNECNLNSKRPPLSLSGLLKTIFIALFCITASHAEAQLSSPLFAGDPFYIASHNTWYAWSQQDSSDDGTNRTDVYYSTDGSNYQVDVVGSSTGSGVVTVNGTASDGNVSGYIISGGYQDAVQTTAIGGSQNANGVQYNGVSRTVTITSFNPDGSPVYSLPVDSYISTDGQNNIFYVSYDASGINGQISGSEGGYVVKGTFLFNSTSSYSETESGFTGNGNSFSLFGINYTITNGSETTSYDSYGTPSWSATDYFNGSDGGTLTIYSDGVSQSCTFSGNSTYFGQFSGTCSNGSFSVAKVDSRSGPSISTSQIWLNGCLLNWQSGQLDASGYVTDTYGVNLLTGGVLSVTIGADLVNYKTTSGSSADVQIIMALAVAGTASYSNNVFTMNDDIWSLSEAAPTRFSPYFITSPSLFVNGTQFDFIGGITDIYGNNTDTYVNGSAGTIVISGGAGTQTDDVLLNYYGINYNGSFNGDGNGGGAFAVGGVDIEITPPYLNGPPAFWIAGSVYSRVQGSGNTYQTTMGQTLTISVQDSNDTLLSGSDGLAVFTGVYTNNSAGLFVCSPNSHNLPRIACPAYADGTLILANAQPPPGAGLPPAVAVGHYGNWLFLGTQNTGASGSSVAYYGNAGGGMGTMLLQINMTDDTVVITNYAGAASLSGTYNANTHLFQTALNKLPVPIYAVDPNNNFMRWGDLPTPAGRPPTVVVGGAVWGYTGTDASGNDNYVGNYSGQELSLGTPGRDGASAVTLYDPNNLNTATSSHAYYGTYFNGGFQMTSGSPVVSAGNSNGVPTGPTDGLGKLKSVGADLDVLGNLFSMGSLTDKPSQVGLTMAFSDNSATQTASLDSSLSRPNARWSWNSADTSTPPNPVPMMTLDSGNRITLYDPANPGSTPIVLDPAGGSRINGPLRIPPSGDIGMGSFTGGPKPDGSN